MSTAPKSPRVSFKQILAISVALHCAVFILFAIYNVPQLKISKPTIVKFSMIAPRNVGEGNASRIGHTVSKTIFARHAVKGGLTSMQGLPSVASNLTIEAETNDTNSATSVTPKEIIRPAFTQRALRNAVEGVVVLDVLVGPDGHVKDARVKEGLGYGLDENALDAMRSSTFSPAIDEKGVAVETWVDYRYRFELVTSS